MNISKETLGVLKNFTQINANFAFKPGNIIQTMSEGRNLFAEATVQENFDTEFGIFNLSEFLGVIGLYGNPDLKFNDKQVIVSENKSQLRYMATEMSILRTPKKSVSFESMGVTEIMSFDMTNELYSKIVKTSAVLHCPDIWFIADGKTLSVVVDDAKNVTTNNFSIELSECNFTFKAHLKIDTFKFIQDDYRVAIAPSVLSFSGSHVNYFVMAELDSEF